MLAYLNECGENRGVMNDAVPLMTRKLVQMLSLWGVDVAFAALCWGVLIAAHLHVTMLTVGPLLVLAAAVWLVVMGGRITAAFLGRNEDGVVIYRRYLMPLVPLWVAVFAATLWLLCYHVGQSLLYYAILPLLFLGAGGCPLLRRMKDYTLLCSALAYAVACAAPAYYYSYSMSPLQVVCSKPVLLLAGVFFLFFAERSRSLPTAGAAAIAQTMCLVALFGVCVYSAANEPLYMRSFYVTLCMAVAVLHGLFRLRSRLPERRWYAFGWGLMALPAVLGSWLFAPEAW